MLFTMPFEKHKHVVKRERVLVSARGVPHPIVTSLVVTATVILTVEFLMIAAVMFQQLVSPSL